MFCTDQIQNKPPRFSKSTQRQDPSTSYNSLRENRKSIPKFLKGKKTFQKCNPPDFKLYPSKLTNKNFPHMV